MFYFFQLLAGKLHTTSSELNLMKAQADEAAAQRSNTWLTKTLSTIRDATSSTSGGSGKTVRTSNSISGGIAGQQIAETNNLGEVMAKGQEKPKETPSRRFSSRDIYYH